MIKNRYVNLMIIAVLLLMLIPASILYGQDEYQKWLAEQNKKYQEYKDKNDKAFVDFLQREWKQMQMMKGAVPDESPKPDELPVADPTESPEDVSGQPKVKIDINLPKPGPPEKPVFIPVPVAPETENFTTMDIAYYGVIFNIRYDGVIALDISAKIDKKTISDFWAMVSRSDYEPLLIQIGQLKSDMALNDWGFSTLLFRIGSNIYPDNQNQSLLLTWFMLTKFGYDVKVGYFDNKIFLLVPTVQMVYGMTYFTIDEKKYYEVSFDNKAHIIKNLFTYDGKYPDADKIMDMRIDNSPKIGVETLQKNLVFSINKKRYSLPVKYNNNLVNFFKTYPLTDLPVYFYSSPSAETKYSLLMNLKPIIEGKSELEAVNIILRFVQTAFEYKTDKEQFGTEKYLFPEETIYYNYSDCEDRSILFAFLVKQLFSLEVIGLDYPGHIATAVKFNGDYDGDFVLYKNKKYIVCDPTYINANAGMCMPRYVKEKPKVIVISGG